MTEERVTVFGLEVAKRRVNVGRVDPALARELFIHHALVLGEWKGGERHPFVERNAATIAGVEALEAKARRRDVLVSDDAIHDLYDALLPDHIASGRHFDRWWRDHRLTQPDLLDLDPRQLIDPDAGEVSATAFPDEWIAGDLTLPLTYTFDPDDVVDGVTADVPLDALTTFDGGGLDWQVPGYREELVTTLVRNLPKQLRRAFVPVPDHVTAFLAEHDPADGPLLPLLARALTQGAGERVTADAFDVDALPPHLRVTFRAVDDRGRAKAWSHDLAALQGRLRQQARAAVAQAAPSIEVRGLASFPAEPLPVTVESRSGGRTVTAYPALVDEGEAVGVRAFADLAAAVRAMRAGTRRLLFLDLGSLRTALKNAVPQATTLALATGAAGSNAEVLADVAAATVDHLVAVNGGPVRDAESYEVLRVAVREDFVDAGLDALFSVGRITTATAALAERLDRLARAATTAAAADDMRTQLRGLVHPGFVTETGIDRLRDVERYLQGIARRAEKVAADPRKDARSMATVHALEDEWTLVAEHDVGGAVRWMLEELRISLFAQNLGTKGSASEAKVRKAITALVV